MDDTALVERFRQGDRTAAQAIVQRHNRRLWRIARGIVRDDAEAEDAVQDAYVRALTSLDGFRGDSSLVTWLSRIVVNEALRRRGRDRQLIDLADIAETASTDRPGSVTVAPSPSPEAAAAGQQIRRIVEKAVDALPAQFRVVFMMRIVEQMSINETASILDIPVATAKTRLHRANQHIRATLGAELAAVFDGTFPFGGSHCERLTRAVLARLPAEAAIHPVNN
ncbi:MAG: RNA polymerase sigma factor [Acetobacteraceae bacterium]